MTNPLSRILRPAHAGRGGWSLRRFFAVTLAFCLGAAIAAAPARAGEARSGDFKGIVELFTSQGCASCPPADALLSGYAQEPGIVALSYHVDYWDYIGWKDMLGSRQNTERQKAYGKAFHTRSVYTPQMVVNGSSHVAGTKKSEIDDALAAGLKRGKGEITLTQAGDTLRVVADVKPARHGGKPDPVLMLVTFRRETVTDVARGENEGQALRNSHSVLDWRVLGAPDEAPLEVELPISMLADAQGEERGCAAFLQKVRKDGSPGPIIAAAMLMIEE